LAEELDFQPLLDRSLISEDAISARIGEDVHEGVTEADENWVDDRVGAIFQIVTQPIVQEFARLWDGLSIDVPSAALPTRAWGDYLDEWMAAFGKERNDATKAVGTVLFEGEEGALIPAQTRVSALQTDPNVAPPEFVTTDSGGAIVATIDEPTNLVATVGAGGTLVDATTYYYYVTAINEYGETRLSNEDDTITADPNRQIALAWDAVDGATGYRVYRSTATGSASKRLLVEVVNNRYTDTGAVGTGTEVVPVNNTTGGRYRAPIEAVDAGALGMVGIGAIENLLDGLDGITGVTNDAPTLNGTEDEDDDQLRSRLSLEFQGGGGGNQVDYQRWAFDFDGVGAVTVIPVADGPGTVTVVISGAGGDPVSEDLVDDVQFALDPLPGKGAGIAPVDHTVTVVTPELVIIDVDAVIDFETGFSLDGTEGSVALRSTIRDALGRYLNTLPSGEDVVFDRIKAAIYTVEGVYKVTSVTADGDTRDITIRESPAETARLGVVTLS
jgi:uncharacterized phage protein gp47/JayE